MLMSSRRLEPKRSRSTTWNGCWRATAQTSSGPRPWNTVRRSRWTAMMTGACRPWRSWRGCTMRMAREGKASAVPSSLAAVACGAANRWSIVRPRMATRSPDDRRCITGGSCSTAVFPTTPCIFSTMVAHCVRAMSRWPRNRPARSRWDLPVADHSAAADHGQPDQQGKAAKDRKDSLIAGFGPEPRRSPSPGRKTLDDRHVHQPDHDDGQLDVEERIAVVFGGVERQHHDAADGGEHEAERGQWNRGPNHAGCGNRAPKTEQFQVQQQHGPEQAADADDVRQVEQAVGPDAQAAQKIAQRRAFQPCHDLKHGQRPGCRPYSGG